MPKRTPDANDTVPHVPEETARLLADMTTEHEKRTLSKEGTLPRPILHASLVGYYTGIIQLLVASGYEALDDPVIGLLADLRDIHGKMQWPPGITNEGGKR